MTAAELRRRLRRIRAFALDVDGVLTDGGMYYGPGGEGFRRFHVRDGMGLRLVREAGVVLALISGERTDIILRRAEKLGIEHVYLGVEDKAEALQGFLRKIGVSPGETAYMGDDVNDVAPMKASALAFTVPGAPPTVRKAAHRVTRLRGGEGAVREICDLLLEARKVGSGS
ncbi:MAG TPA: HAD family hydrolase [Planctomycetota bacterium]|nr:HAD family hydrolase [Planctomycetota bacterium]